MPILASDTVSTTMVGYRDSARYSEEDSTAGRGYQHFPAHTPFQEVASDPSFLRSSHTDETITVEPTFTPAEPYQAVA